MLELKMKQKQVLVAKKSVSPVRNVSPQRAWKVIIIGNNTIKSMVRDTMHLCQFSPFYTPLGTLQSNFSRSNTFGTMKISSRQG